MNAKISIFALFTSLTLLFTSCDRHDHDIPGGIEPPETILKAFDAKYPDARDTEWTVNDDYYVIEFKNNALDNTAWFNHLGVWAMIKTELPLNQLPAPITADIRQGKYAGWKIEEADTIGRAGMGTVYKVEVEKGQQDTALYYTAYGDLIKAAADKDDADQPVTIPEKVANLMEQTFQGAELLDIENTTFGVQLAVLDKTVLKIVKLTQIYTWESTTWKLTRQEVPSVIMNAFRTSEYRNDTVESIYMYVDANGAFYKFNVVHNGQAVTVKFDVFGNIVTNRKGNIS